ncbi:aldehyde dehydrogenase (NADP(+)) [Aestuariibacter halophilus]|uniref:Aldehyde dehydrogenase (NADP(+)) n=1 Tax=Fluctibacter halophilus TaxID=226011 RepID=A0ABS8G357_9ALTE|nr:aldehyde dehydrogenase (NADP(+)) [Aestuariibacter halophilus]MCC2615017.1 aldehyde dehydrogenase (NADP(+)) [Aestuariibacter halophilus]
MSQTNGQLINGQWTVESTVPTFRPHWPLMDKAGDTAYACATDAQIEQAVSCAQQSFAALRGTSAEERAALLDTIADNLLVLGEPLIALTHRETGLPVERLTGERMRTVNQLRLFAQALREGFPQDEVVAADPGRQPLPLPGLRMTHLPLGPVAVFGASNFPYAFSTAGGDTASALAAGCPVVHKAHPAHPGTNAMVADAIVAALRNHDLPAGAFNLLQGNTPEVSHHLVRQDAIKAVGFTGSLAVAEALRKTLNQRDEPIPLYAELGSVNPQWVLPGMPDEEVAELTRQLCQSMLMGYGQFCTSPGVWLVPAGQIETVFEQARIVLDKAPACALLTPGILHSYQQQTDVLALNPQLSQVARNHSDNPAQPYAQLLATDVHALIENPRLLDEVFGPTALIAGYRCTEDMLALVAALPGQLTSSVHGDAQAIAAHREVIDALQYKVGRLIYNQMPTGVELSRAMHHGGPYPASSDVRSTSVGTHAMLRFLRPLCIQNEPLSD